MKKQPLYPHVPKGQVPIKGPFQFYNAGIEERIRAVVEIEPLGWLNKQHEAANIDSARRMAEWIFVNLTGDAAEALRDALSAKLGE